MTFGFFFTNLTNLLTSPILHHTDYTHFFLFSFSCFLHLGSCCMRCYSFSSLESITQFK